MLRIGTHMSIAQGLEKMAEKVVWMEADTMQIFSRNPRGSNYKKTSGKEQEAFGGSCGNIILGPFWPMRPIR